VKLSRTNFGFLVFVSATGFAFAWVEGLADDAVLALTEGWSVLAGDAAFVLVAGLAGALTFLTGLRTRFLVAGAADLTLAGFDAVTFLTALAVTVLLAAVGSGVTVVFSVDMKYEKKKLNV
jgi:hypothetical protein